MRKAFTLIELLIVVAIIAILAAIAVPNFLDAQIRSKVSRAKADMRTLATGLEAYQADNNSYPDLMSVFFNGVFITTPVAYLTSIPEDVFRQGLNKPDPTLDPIIAAQLIKIRWYRYGSSPVNPASDSLFDDPPCRFVLESLGPDIDMDTYIDTGSGFEPTGVSIGFYPGYSPALFSETGVVVNLANATRFKYLQYDPTNGTVSNGDIFRLSDHQLN